jgi:hypothetical protein
MNTTFDIIQGKPIDFKVIVKENGTTLPLVLSNTDTFSFSLVDKKSNVKYIANKAMSITDAVNGEVSGSITALESQNLPLKRSYSEDGYISRPNLRIVINGNTVAQGEMTAIIPNVYVLVG